MSATALDILKEQRARDVRIELLAKRLELETVRPLGQMLLDQMSEADWDKVQRLMREAKDDLSREEFRQRYKCQWSPEQLDTKGPDHSGESNEMIGLSE